MAKDKVKSLEAVAFEETLKGFDDVFNYKEKNYIVDCVMDMKVPNGDWVEAVLYVSTDLSNNDTYCRELKDFIAKFKRGKYVSDNWLPIIPKSFKDL